VCENAQEARSLHLAAVNAKKKMLLRPAYNVVTSAFMPVYNTDPLTTYVQWATKVMIPASIFKREAAFFLIRKQGS